jgi:O-antigen/teichoic acid export membrane protein
VRRAPLWLAAGTAIASLVAALDMFGLPLGPVRAASGTAFALIVPGSAVLLAVRPAVLPPLGRTVLTIPLSLAVLALVGVTVDHTPLGIGAGSLIAGSAITVTALLAIAWWRERSSPLGPDLPDASLDSRSQWISHADAGRHDVLRQGRAWFARVRQHLREPLFLHAYALGVSGLVTSGLGVVYWAVAARLYPPAIVGINAALLSLVTLLASVAQLNLRSGFGRFAPLAGPRTWRLIAGGYAAALAIAVVASVALVRVLAAAPGVLPDVQLTPTLAWLFPLTVVLWTLFVLQDYVLTSLRRTVWVPIENAVFALAKIGALLLFVAPFPVYGILVSWTVPTFIGVVVVSVWLVKTVIPAHVKASPETPSSSLVTLGAVTRYVGVDYLASLFAITSTSILPSIVLAIAGAPASAHFYIVTLVASAGQLLPAVLTTSLLVEASASEATFERDGRRVLGQMLLLLVPLVVILVVGAPLILGIFGAPYAADGTDALRLYALAALPYALVQLAFVRLRVQQQVWAIVVVQAAMATTLVAGSVALLPVYGITGIGAVLLVAETIAALVLSRTVLWPALRGGRENVSWVSQSRWWRPTRRWNGRPAARHGRDDGREAG